MTLESPILNLAEFLGKEVTVALRDGSVHTGVISPSSGSLMPWRWMGELFPYFMNTGSAPALTWTDTGRWDVINEHEYDIMKIDLKLNEKQ
jgi:hypothetical protein